MMRGLKRILAAGIALVALLGFALGAFAAEITTDSLNADGIPAVNFTDLNQASWAEKNIIRMKIRGIVDGYKDGTYRPNSAVRQAEAIIMAVKEMGMEDDVASQTNVSLPAEFGSDIPLWARGYVVVAWQQGLLRPEENNFKWNAPANRAWIAQLVVRVIALDQEALQMTGFLSNFTDDADFPDWARGYIAIALEKEIFAGYADGTFRPGRAVTRAELATILAKSEQYMDLNNVLYGIIEDINADNIIFDDTNHNLYRIYIADGTWIFDSSAKITFAKLREGDQAALVLTGANTAGFIDVLSKAGQDASNEDTVKGEVVRVDTDRYEIRIEDKNGDRTTYDIDSDVDVIIDGDSSPQLRDINVGDEVELQITDGEVTIIEVVSGDDIVEGEVVWVDTGLKQIRIEDDNGDRTTYDIDRNADIIIDGDSSPQLSDIKAGNWVEVRITAGEIDRIEVLEENGDFVVGDLYRVYTDSNSIRIEDRDGDRTTYTVDANADIEVTGITDAKLTDLVTGNPVKIVVENDKVTEIIQGKLREGKVLSVDTADDTVEVERSSGSISTYDVSNNVIIEYGSSTLDLDDLKEKDEVQLYIFDGQVFLIVVTSRS